jgi:hypothetical protein
MQNCNCDACASTLFRLHVGDRIVFSGGFPGREMHELKYIGESAGLRIQGSIGPETILVVTNDSEDNSSTVKKAIAQNLRTASPEQFKIQISKIQDNGRILHKKSTSRFSDLYLSGQKVFPIGLGNQEIEKIETILKKHGASLGQQLRPSLAAGIYNDVTTNNGQCKILISEGVPIFNIKEI